MKSTRIALVVDAFHPASLPAEAVINTLVAEAIADGFGEVDVYCGRGGLPPGGPDALYSQRIHCLPQEHWGFRSLIKLAKRVASNGTRRLIFMYDGGGFDLSSWAPWLPQLLRVFGYRGRIVVHFTNTTRPHFGRSLQRMIGFARRFYRAFGTRTGGLGDSDRLVFYCQSQRDDLTEGLELAGGTVSVSAVPSTVVGVPDIDEVNALREKLGFDRSTPSVMYFGLIYPSKGIETLLQACQILSERGVPHRLLMVGGSGGLSGSPEWRRSCDAYYDAMRLLSSNLKISCTWVGSVDCSDIVNYFALADIACLPFTHGVQANNSSFSSLAASGIPVVTTHASSTDDIFRDPNIGVSLVNPGDSYALAATLEWILGDSDQLKAMSGQIKAFHSRFFSLSGLMQGLMSDDAPPLKMSRTIT